MNRVDIKTGRAQLGALAERAAKGESIILTKRGKDMAIIAPLGQAMQSVELPPKSPKTLSPKVTHNIAAADPKLPERPSPWELKYGKPNRSKD